MWGATSDANPDLISLHVYLSDQLSDLAWSRVQVWNHSISVHAWKVGSTGPEVAFDTFISEGTVSVNLVVRETDWSPSVHAGLVKENVTFSVIPNRPGRYRVSEFQFPPKEDDAPKAFKQLAQHLRFVRSAVQNSVRADLTWHDPSRTNTVSYAVKAERKSSKQIIFLFTSIRNRQHWLDFGGPNGTTLATNRARIVFLYDDSESDFTYHLAVNGDTGIRTATASFIRHYVESEGYTWDSVTLAGMSKGGTSAIVVGAMLPQCTVVALAPQLTLGNYLKTERPGILKVIAGSSDSSAARNVDALMWDAFRSQFGIARCYIFTSENDPNCTDGISRFRGLFGDPASLSVFKDVSEFTSSHVDTVLHLSPLFVSQLGVLASGWRP